ncbi:hypothetical protein SSX86_024141 [Deinandra increscens subsp. villosa]|uniref:Protein kinase domain-containing protein n=1 Tax=Deinandra increscens subsp. villosa TaxID=3103831 RepID=A0AAP0CKS9_9ASTR
MTPYISIHSRQIGGGGSDWPYTQAKAIETLHSSISQVIHRDIKSGNTLIDRNFNARLGDLGLALRCHVDDFRLLSTPPAGTMRYINPGYVTLVHPVHPLHAIWEFSGGRIDLGFT